MDFTEIQNRSIHEIKEQITQLKEKAYNHPDINLFVKKLMYAFGKDKYSNEVKKDFDYVVSDILSMFVYQIFGVDVGIIGNFNISWAN